MWLLKNKDYEILIVALGGKELMSGQIRFDEVA